jgi:hypothetical protein
LRKLVDHVSKQEPYTNRAAILGCPDRRFRGWRRKLERLRGIEMSDPILIPGGAKALAIPTHPRDVQFILEGVELLRSHGFSSLFCMAHNQCAACDQRTDRAFYEAMLLRAGNILRDRFPTLEVIPIFVDFDGIYLVEKGYARASA